MAVGEEKMGPFDWTEEEEEFYFNFCKEKENGSGKLGHTDIEREDGGL